MNRGSADITRNIMQSLSLTFTQSEQMKREVGLDKSTNPQVAEVVSLSVEYILSETNSIVLNYEKKYNKSISKIILTGGGALTKGLLARATENFRSEVIYGDSFGKTETPSFLAPILSASGPEFAVAVGLALRELQ